MVMSFADSNGSAEELSIGELRQIASRQQKQIEVQLGTLRQREAQLSQLKKSAGSRWNRGLDAVDLRLRHLISRVDSQESQLSRLRALRQQLDHFRHANDLLETELASAKTDFDSKKLELQDVSQRVNHLRIQIERARKPLPPTPDSNLSVGSQKPVQPTADERLAKLRESVMRKRQESAILRKEAISNGIQPPSSPPLNHRRGLSHAPRQFITETYCANKNNLSNTDVLRRYRESALQAYKEKVEQQVVGNGNGDSGNEDTCSSSDTNSQSAASDPLPQEHSPVEINKDTLADIIKQEIEIKDKRNSLVVSDPPGAPIACLDDMMSDTDSSSGRGSPVQLTLSTSLPPLPITPPHDRSDSVSSHSTATNSVSGGILVKSGKESRSESSRSVTFAPLAVLLDAAMEGEIDLVRSSAEKVEDLSGSNEEGITALHNAVCAAHANIVEFLVEKGADVNAADSDGWTALHCAASCHSLSLCKLLIEAGAVIHAKTSTDHETALDFSQENSPVHEYLLEEIQRLGVDREGRVFSMFDYKPSQADELPLTKDLQLTVLKKGDQTETDWYWCVNPQTKAEGYVANNFISLYPRRRANRS